VKAGLTPGAASKGMAQSDPLEGLSTGKDLDDQASLAVENLRLLGAQPWAEGVTEEFIGGAAHELKQPLAALKGYTQMLIMSIGGELTPTQRQFVDVIDANVERMGKLINDLLEVCRLEAGLIQLNLAPTSLIEILDETLSGTRAEIEARHHALEIDLPEDLPLVLGDRERLIQALTHLVRNACRYTPEGGHLRLAACCQEGDAGQVCVRVVDSGIGLSPEEMLRLGEKFYRAEHDLVRGQQGHGLGLTITRGLVALHGGELWVRGEPGRGSTFAFTLPAARGGEAAGCPRPAPDGMHG